MFFEFFLNFDDLLDLYNVWREIFINIISELKVFCNEEFELMLNRFIGNFKFIVIGICNVNFGKFKEVF